MTRPNFAPDAREGTERNIEFSYDICAQGYVATHIERLPYGSEIRTRICHCGDGETGRPGVAEAIANLQKWGVGVKCVPTLDDPNAVYMIYGYIVLHDTPSVREQLRIIDTGFGHKVTEQINALLAEAKARGFEVGSMAVNGEGDVFNHCPLSERFHIQVYKPWREQPLNVIGWRDGLLLCDGVHPRN